VLKLVLLVVLLLLILMTLVLLLALFLLVLLLRVLPRSVPFLSDPWIRILSVLSSFVYKANRLQPQTPPSLGPLICF
jgi:hypothetical protein